jgi:cyanophycin synthetase
MAADGAPPAPRVLDSRRLTGPSLMLDRPGAILDVALDGADPSRAIAAWRDALARLLAALGWAGGAAASRVHASGMSLAFEAPADALYAATEVNEAAWREACAALGFAAGAAEPESRSQTFDRLRAAIDAERKPWFETLAREAASRDVTLLADDRRVSVGLGAGSRAWPIEESTEALPRLRWAEVHDVPVALITGTNGKTTTARLLGAIARAAGRVAGVTTTDQVTVGDEVVATGDYSGPNGARTVLRDRRVEIAVLEVARGGILRRGLAVPRAAAAAVTNVANDHLGESGIHDLDALADVKLVVAKAIDPDGRLILNADDARLLERGRAAQAPVLWFSLDAAHPVLRGHLERDGWAAFRDGDALVIARGRERRVVTRVAEVPIAFGGAAPHNVANALAAIGLAATLGLPDTAIRAGLAGFASDPRTNPGRANVWRLGGVTAIVDYAHNPHGLAALAALVASMPATRRGLVIGQAGDRDDASIREFARAAWAMAPAHVFVKEMESYLRGRELGAVPAILDDELRRAGAGDSARSHWSTELDAVRGALGWARDGDLLLLTTHAQRDEVIGLLERLARERWQPGQTVV